MPISDIIKFNSVEEFIIELRGGDKRGQSGGQK